MKEERLLTATILAGFLANPNLVGVDPSKGGRSDLDLLDRAIRIANTIMHKLPDEGEGEADY